MRKPLRLLAIGAAAAVVVAGGTTAALAADHDDDGTADRPVRATVGLGVVEQAALAAVPGGRVTDAELENEHRRPVWELDLTTGRGQEYDVTVDAATGKVLDHSRDHDDDHDDDS